MDDTNKTDARLLDELNRLRARVAELERTESGLGQTEEALRHGERRFRELVDSLPETIYVTDESGHITFINSTALAVFGYTLSDLESGLTPDEVFAPEDRQRAAQNLRRTLNGERGTSIEYTGLRKDGTTFPIILHANPIIDRGKCVGSRGVVVDITEQRRAEKQLRESEERFRNLAEYIPGVSIQGYKTDGTVFYWNKASEAIYGYTNEEAIGKNLGDLIVPPDLRPLFRKCLEVGKEANESGEFMPPGELLLLHKDGHIVPVYSIHTAVYVEDAEPLLFCIDVDLSERKRAEAAVQDALLQFESVVESMPMVAIQGFGEDGVIRVWNSACEQLYGFSAEEVLGRRVQDILLSGDEAQEFLLTLAGIYEMGHSTAPREWMTQTRNGGKRWVYSTMFPIFKDGKVAEVFCADVDITERKRVEEQLRQSQKMEAVGHLAGGIAHDFNNILQAIIGYTQLAIGGLSESDKHYEDLKVVLDASRRASDLTRQLLAFSRRQVLEAADVDLGRIIAELTKMLRRIIRENIQLSVVTGDDLRTIHADRAMIEQMLTNLCVNARDAMTDGGPLTVKAENVDIDETRRDEHAGVEPGPYVCLSVTDAGTGIAPEILDRIFEPFFTTKEIGEGSGLGLAMVYGIAKQHGGAIDVQSELGVGTTFTIYLPTVDRQASADRGQESVVTGGTETILVAEDESVVRDLAVRVLGENGYTVLSAEDGEAAVRVFEENADSIDLAFLDVVMPKLSGIAASEHIRALKPGVIALLCSGYNPDGSQPGFVRDERIPLIPKPYTADALLRRIRILLDADRD